MGQYYYDEPATEKQSQFKNILHPRNHAEKCALETTIVLLVLGIPLSLATSFWIVTQGLHHMGWGV